MTYFENSLASIQELINQSLDSFKIAAEMANQVKGKRSWSSLIFRTDYNKFTDEEIASEIAYCVNVAGIGAMTFMQDKSAKGLITAAMHFNKCYKIYL